MFPSGCVTTTPQPSRRPPAFGVGVGLSLFALIAFSAMTPMPAAARVAGEDLAAAAARTASSPEAAAARAGPPGASRAFVSDDPTIARARRLYDAGAFAEIERLLADGSATDASAAAEMLDLVRRARRDYRQTPQRLLQKVSESIPGVTNEDISRWIAAGDVQHRKIDGTVAIFHREPGHLFRFGREAIAMRDAARASRAAGDAANADSPATTPARWTLHDHLRAVIEEAAAASSPHVLPVRHRITYTLTVAADRAAARRGSKLAVWLPFPQAYGRQRDVRLVESDPPAARVAESATDGDPVAGPAQRTAYLERTIEDPSKPHAFRVVFEFTTSAYYPDLTDRAAQPAAPPLSASTSYLLERPPHIAFTPQLRAKTAEIVGDDPDALSRARKIFCWIDANLRWTPEEEYCIIPNLSMHGFSRGKGDCGVASMLFITMCRIAGVPARWQSGWTTNPVGWNMHDWAEIYVQPWGWLPVDASYGRQKHDDPAIRDFYFGHADSHRLIVNLDYGRELDPPKRSLRSEPLDFQRGEVELDGRNLYFDDWDYDIAFEREPGP